jgi:hypothetical protein
MTTRAIGTKAAIGAAVALMHAFVFVAIDRLNTTDSIPDPTFRSQIFFVEPTSPESVASEPARSPSIWTADPSMHVETDRTIESSTASLSLPSIDWQTARHRAAADVAARLPPVQNAKPMTSPGDLLRRPLHRRGDSQQLGQGEVITWIDGRCYVTNQPSAAARLDENAIVTICRPRDTPIRGDLFDDLRPRYLDEMPLSVTHQR